MKEKIFNTFQSLGFLLEKLDDFGYKFQYERILFIWIPDNDDEEFLCIGTSGLVEKSEMDEATFYKLLNNLNETLKYVKVYNFGDSIWLFYERELYDEHEDIEGIISRMVVCLEASLVMFRMLAQKVTGSMDDETEEDDDNGSDDFVDDMEDLNEERENIE